VYVRRRPDFLGSAAGLFRGHVPGRSDEHSRQRVAGRVVRQLGQSEVGQFRNHRRKGSVGTAVAGFVSRLEQNVARLDVAVQDTPRVHVPDRVRECGHESGGLRRPRRVGPAGEPRRQGQPGAIRRYQIRDRAVLSDLEHRDQIRVFKTGNNFRFPPEPVAGVAVGQQGRVGDFESHAAAEPRVERQEDDALPAPAEFAFDPEPAERRRPGFR
jgi:hypothetical protein